MSQCADAVVCNVLHCFYRSMFSASESGRSSDSMSEEFGDPGADFGVGYNGKLSYVIYAGK